MKRTKKYFHPKIIVHSRVNAAIVKAVVEVRPSQKEWFRTVCESLS